MSEIVDVLSAIESLREKGEQSALATVVAARGSTYRRPGARLLLSESGELIGNISGGCLDNDIRAVANEIMDGAPARVVDFDLTADDEAVWGWGLGCNGALEVFVEPTGKAVEISTVLKEALIQRRPVGLVTVLTSEVPNVEPGARLLVNPDGSTEGTLGSENADKVAVDAALRAMDSGKSARRELELDEGEVSAFVESLEPPLKLLVCGAGEDALPMVRFAAEIGWEPVVIDDRENLLNHERFPEAKEFIHLEDATKTSASTSIDRFTAAVVMTHNYLRDKDHLTSLFGTDVFYIGSLGPKTRLRRELDELADEGVEPSDEDKKKIYGPAGLDIGAEGPEEIAWGVVAEIIAVRSGRNAGFLRDRKGPTHPRTEETALSEAS
jgi:xanthine dehydrogenase accessory factor